MQSEKKFEYMIYANFKAFYFDDGWVILLQKYPLAMYVISWLIKRKIVQREI